jgi:hypothetical protein
MQNMTSTKTIKTVIVALLIFAGTCSVTQAAAPSRLSEAEARHLLVRTGFAPKQTEVEALAGKRCIRRRILFRKARPFPTACSKARKNSRHSASSSFVRGWS